MMARFLGLFLGLSAHLLLGVTIWYLFPFLRGRDVSIEGSAAPGWWLQDALLVLQFGVSHSLLLYPRVRDRLDAHLPGRLHGCFFTLTTCLSLLLLMAAWQASPVVLWHVQGWAAWAIYAGYLLSWMGLFYSLSLTGLGFQTGWTPFWAWLHGRKPPRRTFAVRGAYHLLRHPVYLSFLGLVWFAPLVTLDRALLTGMMTIYIFIGSYLKDRRLEYYLGDVYRDYQARVAGYPLIGLGPLGRVQVPVAKPEPVQV
jgi:protein-S-isoprenylcysteine O-methyltransferase Ste14